MADATRIKDLTETTTLSPDMNLAVDNASGGTKRIQLSTLIDETLTTAGKAADAKAVGDEITGLKSALDQAIEEFAVPTQEAVDNWLNAHPEATTTVQDGSITFQKFSSDLKQKVEKMYTTVAAMVADTTLTSGQVCGTLGFYAKSDGGAAVYTIRQLASGETADGATTILLDSGLVAEINILGDVVNMLQVGAKTGNNTFDNAPVLQKAITYIYTKFPCTNMTGGHNRGGGTVYFPGGLYYFLTGEIDINGYFNLTIAGDSKGNSIIVNSTTYLFTNAQSNTMGFYAKDITVLNNGLISSINAWEYTFENCRFFNIQPASNAFAVRLYLSVNVKFIRCIFFNCGLGVQLSGSAGSGASTSVLFTSCWFSHCTTGIEAGFNSNKLVTLWVENSIFEYNTYGIQLAGNSNGESIGSLKHLHFEGNTNAITVSNFSLSVGDLLLPDNQVLKINSNSNINSVTGTLRESADFVYQNNLGYIRMRFGDGSFIDSSSKTYYEQVYTDTGIVFERYGNVYMLRLQGASASKMGDFFTSCKNYLPSGYMRTVVADAVSGGSVVLSLRSIDLVVITISPWAAVTTYELTGTVTFPTALVYKG